MENMKILFVCNNFKPSWEAGGEVRFVYDLAQALIKKGHQVTVFTNDYYRHDYGVELGKPVDVDGVTVFYFDNLLKRFPSFCFPPLPLNLPRRLLKNIQDFDIIHIHGHRNLLELVVSWWAQSKSIPFIIQAHGSAAYHNMRLMKTIFDRMMGDRILSQATAIVISTPNEQKEYKSIGAPLNLFETAANGIDLSLFTPLPPKGLFRKRFGVEADKTLILFLGRINEIKSLDMLIDAFALLNKELSSTVLALVGPADDIRYLNELQKSVNNHGIKNSVLFCGPLYGGEKVQAYVDADIYVQPSKYESFSNTIVEALTAGTPVVFSKDCNISEALTGMGIAVNHDVKSFKEAMKILALNPDIRRKYGDKGQKNIPELYDLNRVVHDYIDIYHRALQRKK